MVIKTFEDLRAELELNSGVMFLGQVAEEVYRAHEALSQSELKVVAQKSPAHLRYQRRVQKPQTEAMRLGTAIHSALLEPDKFHELYIRAPNCDRRTKEGRELWNAILTESKELGKKVLVDDEWEVPFAIREALSTDLELSRLLRDGVSERSCFGTVFGTPGKALLDYYRPQNHEIVDLKSTKCASLDEFQRDLRKYRYHWQAVWYSDLVKEITGQAPTFKILAVETAPPYCAAVFTIKFDLMAIARKEMQATVDLVKRCMDTGFWPGYPASEIGALPSEWLNFKKSLGA